jgi:hypothetical protein
MLQFWAFSVKIAVTEMNKKLIKHNWMLERKL